MKKITVLLFSIVCIYAHEFTIYTENNAPWNYKHEGKVKGVVTRIVREIQKEVGNNDKIELIAWNRAYKETLKKPNRILFSTARIQSREKLFQWVGPVVVDEVYLYKHKDAKLSINSLEDAKKVGSIDAGPPTNAAYIVLKERGFTNLSELSRDIGDLKALKTGRIDLLSMGRFSLSYKGILEQIDTDEFVNTGVLVYEHPLYIAFSNDIDQKIVQKWRDSFQRLQKEGIIKQIIKKELNSMVKNAKN